ncbi:MAG TPA: hypothetical protein PLA50_08450 [Bacteroidia bacterium]|nr:hypothetical protein [Bacteroidia bacterium]
MMKSATFYAVALAASIFANLSAGKISGLGRGGFLDVYGNDSLTLVIVSIMMASFLISALIVRLFGLHPALVACISPALTWTLTYLFGCWYTIT